MYPASSFPQTMGSVPSIFKNHMTRESRWGWENLIVAAKHTPVAEDDSGTPNGMAILEWKMIFQTHVSSDLVSI